MTFDLPQQRYKISRRHNAKNIRPVRLNTGGDSASALRALRNGAPHTGAKGKKEGRRNRGAGAFKNYQKKKPPSGLTEIARRGTGSRALRSGGKNR